MTTEIKDPRAILTAPLRASEIEWKIQSSRNGKTLVVPYIDSRCVMERFDTAFGWGNWSDDIREINGGFLCTITVQTPAGTVSKTDGAGKTDIEPVKGGISDAMKRCAVKFGLGRDLYTYPKLYIEGEHKYIPGWALKQLDGIVETFLAGKLDREAYVLKDGTGNSAPQQPQTAPPSAGVQSGAAYEAEPFTTDLGACATADHLNQFTKRYWMSKMGEDQKSALWGKAKSIGCKWNKEKKAFE